MGFIEAVFGTEASEGLTEAHLLGLIERAVPEGLSLDYKQAGSLEQPETLSKHASGLANSNGGLLIVGMATKKPKKGHEIPTRIDWDTNSAHTMMWFQNVVLDPIRPSLRGVQVRTIQGAKGIVFVIDVPQSETPPHMAADHCYYFRSGDRTQPMEHYQVADLLGKRRKPVLRPELEITAVDEAGRKIDLSVKVYNDGRALAKWPMTYLVVTGAEDDKETERSGMWTSRRFEKSGNSPGRLIVSTKSPIEVIHPGFYLTYAKNKTTMSGLVMMIHLTISAEEVDTSEFVGIIDSQWLAKKWKREADARALEVPLLGLTDPIDNLRAYTFTMPDVLERVLVDKNDPVCLAFARTLNFEVEDLAERLLETIAETRRMLESFFAEFQKESDNRQGPPSGNP
jgi:hypothetical protein